MFNTLNLSIKNNNYSIETNNPEIKSTESLFVKKKESAEQRTLDERINQLEDDKEKLLIKIKEMENTICVLNKEKEKLKTKFNNEHVLKKKTEEKLEKVLDDQNQLILVLKIIEQKGIDIEEIIDEWNKEVEQEEEQHHVYSNTTNNEHKFSESYSSIELDSSVLVPINVTEENKRCYTYSNIPKLDFDKLKRRNEHTINRETNHNIIIKSTLSGDNNKHKHITYNKQPNINSNLHNKLKSAILGNDRQTKTAIELMTSNAPLLKKKNPFIISLNHNKKTKLY